MAKEQVVGSGGHPHFIVAVAETALLSDGLSELKHGKSRVYTATDLFFRNRSIPAMTTWLSCVCQCVSVSVCGPCLDYAQMAWASRRKNKYGTRGQVKTKFNLITNFNLIKSDKKCIIRGFWFLWKKIWFRVGSNWDPHSWQFAMLTTRSSGMD